MGRRKGGRRVQRREGWHRRTAVAVAVFGVSSAGGAVTDPGPVDLSTREGSRTWFLTWWPKGFGASMGFTGDVDAGVAGDTSQEWKDQQCLRINTYRRLTGLHPVTFTVAHNQEAQEAALLCAANGESSHAPPSTWRFWTEGRSLACSHSLLGPNVDYENPINGYISDGGEKNLGLGHRLVLLDASIKFMGTGDVPENASRFGTFGGDSFTAIYGNDPSWGDVVPEDTPPLLLWPAKGYLPHCLLPAKWVAKIPDDATTGRLTLASANVAVTRNGVPLPVWTLPLNAGIGLTFTLDGDRYGGVGWAPDGHVVLPPRAGTPIGNETVVGFAVEDDDVTYRVELSGIRVRATGELWNGDGRYVYEVIGYNHNRGPALPGAGDLINVSTRSYVGAGSSTQIGGFVLKGDRPRRVLIRASGPALATFGLSGLLSDPHLTLWESGQLRAENDDWGTAGEGELLESVMPAVGAFAWQTNSRDAALLVTLEPGKPYSAHVTGTDRGNGIGLVEIYDADEPGNPTRLINLSSRTYVGKGEQVQIAGFVLKGDQARTVLIRVSGPSLAQFGVENPLPRPYLVLRNGSFGIRASNGWTWNETEADVIEATSDRVGAYSWSRGSHDAALVAVLLPGQTYSVIVTDQTGAEGQALVEIYSVP